MSLGDRASSLAELHERMYLPMVRLATLLTDSEAVAEDVVQDCFARLYPRFDRVTDPVPYLRRAVVNACRSWGRRHRLERAYLARQGRPATVDLGAEELVDALGRLPHRQRAAVVLRFYEDLSSEEIASVLGCPVGTAKALVHRGVARLREVVER